MALALAAGTMTAQAQNAAAVVPEPGVVVSGVAPAPAYAAVYPAPVYATATPAYDTPVHGAPVYVAPVAYVEPPRYVIDPVATVLTAVGVGLLFGIGGHHGGPGPGPRRW